MANTNSRRLALILCYFLVLGGLDRSYVHGEISLDDGCPIQFDCSCNSGSDRSWSVTVDCSGKNLTHVPPGIGPNTTMLDLSANNISFLPARAFEHLPHLMELRLADNKLSDLPASAFQGLHRLKILKLQINRMTTVPADALQDLPNLVNLHLDANDLRDVPAHSFQGLHSLRHLWLESNFLTEVPVEAINRCPSLEAITLALNNITSIPDNAFVNLTRLMVLLLNDNQIGFMGDSALNGLERLRDLLLHNNLISEFPVAISVLGNLEELDLERNRIPYIRDHAFAGNPELMTLKLLGNKIQTVGKYAFSNMPRLEKLVLSAASDLIEFPDLTGSYNIETLHLDRGSLHSVPDNLCQLLPKLKSLDLHSNKIPAIPDLSECHQLRIINLGGNNVVSLEGGPLKDLNKLRDLTLNNNDLKYLPKDAFEGLNQLQYLDLKGNYIEDIHPEAFAPLESLVDLNLADNRFPELPTIGLQKLLYLKTAGTDTIHDFPPASTFPNILNLRLSYAYHCCEFLREPEESPGYKEKSEWITDLDYADWENMTRHIWGENWTFGYEFSNEMTIDYNNVYEEGTDTVPDFISHQYPVSMYEFEDFSNRGTHSIDCLPKPGPFTPCEDLFGWWALRLGVWVVFLLALLGNGTVIFVIVVSRTKMCVPRFLICNLACADFFMGIYLGFLAIIDASTLGDFKQYAVTWQNSSGCQIAGFLAVLSSELSVYTLAVITMERHYAITHAMHLNKRLTLKTACLVMAGGWLLALLCATLPLVGFSSYSKFAICLPFETGNNKSLGYVMAIMTLNALAFCIIVGCYMKMYCSIRGSQAWNSNDSRVAKRMALLVFTDFACWAPIAFFSLTSMFHVPLISTKGAKILTIFVLPMNSCANPFLYAIFTKQFKKDCAMICRRLEERSTLSTRSLIKLNNSKHHHSSSGLSSRQVSMAEKGRNSLSCSNGLPADCYQQLIGVKPTNKDFSTGEEKSTNGQNQLLLYKKNFGDIPLVTQQKECNLTTANGEW
ncbi:leucine-rich repeat-containing G-protein coupled receptor 5-like [Ptychodera flava]|uniref:leucine-rich repeat-containing G-protein coupled receptor 5-like n=1 Tax=Ptychodera flava TaxID=63121 RepID=UPI00396A8553